MDAAVRIFHEALERTKLAQALADGTVSKRAYREYLRNSLVVWEALEQKFELARQLGVAERIREDLYLTAPDPYEDESVHWRAEWQAKSCTENDLWVLGLGLCYGGKQMAKSIKANGELPTAHMKMPKRAVPRLRALETSEAGIATAFQNTLAWYHNVA